MLCHAIIGRNPHKERIMTVDIVCLFIAPLLEFSTKEVTFRMEQVHNVLIGIGIKERGKRKRENGGVSVYAYVYVG